MIIAVKHNIEVAHRLYQTKGKCEAIHGHSMWVELRLQAVGTNKTTGIAYNFEEKPLEFGEIKKAFRGHLDEVYDHHLLLNKEDPWSQPIDVGTKGHVGQEFLPGLNAVAGDPSTENIALWIAEFSAGRFKVDCDVAVWETRVNMAQAFAFYLPSEGNVVSE